MYAVVLGVGGRVDRRGRAAGAHDREVGEDPLEAGAGGDADPLLGLDPRRAARRRAGDPVAGLAARTSTPTRRPRVAVGLAVGGRATRSRTSARPTAVGVAPGPSGCGLVMPRKCNASSAGRRPARPSDGMVAPLGCGPPARPARCLATAKPAPTDDVPRPADVTEVTGRRRPRCRPHRPADGECCAGTSPVPGGEVAAGRRGRGGREVRLSSSSRRSRSASVRRTRKTSPIGHAVVRAVDDVIASPAPTCPTRRPAGRARAAVRLGEPLDPALATRLRPSSPGSRCTGCGRQATSSTSSSPTCQRSPITGLVDVEPSVVRFSPNAPARVAAELGGPPVEVLAA